MPLHLLGKKSWNVYNPANIARVKRDEAEAQAQSEAEAKRKQELDAERRLAILRGEVPPTLPPSSPIESSSAPGTHRKREPDDNSAGQFQREERKKRKRFGEDDTDFEMRVARERANTAAARTTLRLSNSSKMSDAPLVDSKGHIALFHEKETDNVTLSNQKNEDAEREAAKKHREFEDQYTMRFANAGGRGGAGVTGSGPWYASNGASDLHESVDVQALMGRDVWGNEDPKRKQRDAARVVANDPLAMMKRGAAKVRDVERERRASKEEKTRELKDLLKDEKRREKRRGRHSDPSQLEGFSLDAQAVNDDDRKNKHREHRHHRRSDHDDNRERHHRHHHEHRHEKSKHQSNHGKDSGERERRSLEHGRRQLEEPDRY